MNIINEVQVAEVVLPCKDLDATVNFFNEQLGFDILLVFPADNPTVTVVTGHGLRIRLERSDEDAKPDKLSRLRLLCEAPAKVANGQLELTAPNGTRIELADANPPLIIPPINQSFVLSKMNDKAQWIKGRAGMRYRDLIPDRQGGRFVASHIHIPNAGPIPDYAHYHKVRFQMIFCYKGWARLVYEDQGEPFLFHAGDCVMQPPQIRHRVLESSGNFDVVEIGCPAEHETYQDLEIELPTGKVLPDRDYNGQHYVHHIAAEADWGSWRLNGFESRDTGIGKASKGLAGVRVVRSKGASEAQSCSHDAEFMFMFVLHGAVTLRYNNNRIEQLTAGDSFVIPEGVPHSLADSSADLEILEVTLPNTFKTTLL